MNGNDERAQGSRGGLTYAEAGVDIDAGNALVNRIRPGRASWRGSAGSGRCST